jgi:hypothetical protein
MDWISLLMAALGKVTAILFINDSVAPQKKKPGFASSGSHLHPPSASSLSFLCYLFSVFWLQE